MQQVVLHILVMPYFTEINQNSNRQSFSRYIVAYHTVVRGSVYTRQQTLYGYLWLSRSFLEWIYGPGLRECSCATFLHFRNSRSKELCVMSPLCGTSMVWSPKNLSRSNTCSACLSFLVGVGVLDNVLIQPLFLLVRSWEGTLLHLSVQIEDSTKDSWKYGLGSSEPIYI